jgi:hypothetical protein
MLSVAKLLLSSLLFLGFAAQSREMTILVLGEGASANCNQHLSSAVSQVFQLTRGGELKPAVDPLDLAECSGGSIWIPLGQQLINSRMADRIVLVSIAVRQASVADWLPRGKVFPRLKSVVELANLKKISFDYVFWQQGYSDEPYSAERYFNDLRAVIKYVSTNIKVGGWIIAKGTGCPGIVRKGVEEAQVRMGRLPIYRRFAGPDTNRLAPTYSFGNCGLNQDGQNQMATLWAKAVFEAEKNAGRFQKESLLFYFR